MERGRDLRAPRWRRLLWLAPAVAFVALLVYGVAARGAAPKVGAEVPELSGPLLMEDGEFALSELRGQPVFVNFWWSGCVPCKEEAPLLSRAAEEYRGRVAFVGVNVRDAKSEAVGFARAEGLDFPHVRDEGLELYRRYGLTGQPESFFIDDEGVLVQHIAGQLTERSLYEFLEILVARDG